LYIHTGTYHWIGLTSKVNDFHWVHDKKKPIFVKFASGYPVKSGKYSYFIDMSLTTFANHQITGKSWKYQFREQLNNSF
jgi:hypothetical protein